MERNLQNSNLPTVGPLDIVVYHVGGDDGSGPIGALFEIIPNAIFVAFEIRDDAAPVSVTQADDDTQQVRIKVNRAVDGGRGTKEFYVTNKPKSSSLLKPSPMARDEDPGMPFCQTWGDNTRIVKTIEVQTSSIAQIIEELGLPAPDIISSDAQGAELRILDGAGRYLDNALGVVTEVEFSEIYHRQALFDDQMMMLSPKGFRLVNLMNMQVWHPVARMRGMGFLTVGEAIWVKYFHAFAPGEERPARGYVDIAATPTTTLLKMCIIAMGFRMLSYAVKVAKYVKAERNDYQQYMHLSPVLTRAFEMLETFEAHEQQTSRPFDFYIDAIQFPESVYLRNAALDAATLNKGTSARKALLREAVALYRNGDSDKAKEMCNLVLAGDPSHFDARHLVGVIALQSGNAAEAVAILSHATALVPDRPYYALAYNNRGIAYTSLGKLDEALADFDKALKLGGPRSDVLLQRANILFNLGRNSEAISDYDSVIRLQADNAEAYRNRGFALASMERKAEAMDSLKKSLQFDPNSENAKAKLNELLS